MIYDTFANFDRYKCIAPEVWDKVKSFTIKALQNGEVGKFPIHGDNCFANIAIYDTQELDVDKLEAHEEYLDIQITLRGVEKIYCRGILDLDEVTPFSTEKDVGFFHMELDNVTELEIGNSRFAIFYPGEGHLPGCVADDCECGEVLKMIVKIHRSYLV